MESNIDTYNQQQVDLYSKLVKENPIIKEVSFKYKNGVNLELFNFLGYSEEEFETKLAVIIYNEGNKKFDNLIQQLETIKNNIKVHDLKEEIFKNILQRKIHWLNFLKAGLIFEIEKAGKDTSGMEVFKKQSLEELEKYNTLLYGESLVKNPEWAEKIYAKVFSLYQKKGNSIGLTTQERSAITSFLSKILIHVDNKSLSVLNINENLEKEVGPQIEKKDIFNKKLSAQQARRVFELVLEIYSKIFGIKFNQEVVIENRNTVSVNSKKLMLVNKEYTIYNMISLIAHEIEKHIARIQNVQKGKINIKDPEYQEIEESTAVIFENIVLENKIPLISKMLPITIAGEVFDKENKIKKFISGYLKLLGDDTSMLENRFQRIKQYYPYNQKGAWRKGIVYSTGIPKVLEFIKKGEVKKLFLGAFSYETLKNTKNIENYFNTIVYPVLLAEVLKYIIDNDLINDIINGKPIITKKLIKHLQEKYGQFGIDIKQELSKLNKIKRENKEKLPEIQGSTRKKMIEILKIIEK